MKPNIAIRLALGLIATAALLSGCVGLPQGIEPVRGFELDRYLGKWYEIARLDHSVERGLQIQVGADPAGDFGKVLLEYTGRPAFLTRLLPSASLRQVIPLSPCSSPSAFSTCCRLRL